MSLSPTDKPISQQIKEELTDISSFYYCPLAQMLLSGFASASAAEPTS